ncbi:MAG: ATP-binding protein, partial [Treponema sp.]|nr:ATP-binding protein [Treponema sp.]
LDSINGVSDSNTDPEVVRLTKGPYEYASVAQIGDSEWSVIVLTGGYSLTDILDFLPLLVTMLAGFILYMISHNVLINRLVIKPLGRLGESLPEPDSYEKEIFGCERSDEIGDLARKIRKISDRISENKTENERHRSLMCAVNNAASILLVAEVKENFKASLMSVMELMGACVDIDRINIWRNDETAGILAIDCQYEWLGSINRLKNSTLKGTKFPYNVNVYWKEKIHRGECVNGPASGFSPEIQEFLGSYEIKSILAVPIHIENHFWGFISFDDCRKERVFTEDEVNALNSAGLMMVNAVNRNAQANKLQEAHQRTKLIMDAMPLCTNLWDRNLRPFDCNEEAVKLYNLANKQEFLDRFFDLSPEYQSDGQLSKGKALMYLQKAFDEGKCVFEWMHQQLDGTPMPAEVTLVRVSYDEDYAVASYIRDLREHKLMMKEIEQRDRLLNTVNETATILLQADYEKIGYYLQSCMGMMGEAVGVDRVYLWRNHTKDGELYCTQLYEWSEGAKPLQDSEYAVDVSYNEKCPEWKEMLIKGNCINDLVKNMSAQTQSQLGPQGVLSVLIVPVFLRNEFWGFFGFDDCHTERVFSKNAESILRSASLLIANVLLRNDMTESIRTSAVRLEAALKEARSASEAKTKFLASMSHEMRTPLNAIVGLSQITIESGGLNDESALNLDKIFNAGLALLNTANDVLDISRIEAGKLELAPIEYDIPSLINNTVTQSIVHRKEKPVKFILDIDKDLPVSLYGDDLRIRQILINLLSNAFKYTKEGTVELGMRCTREANTVWMTAWVRDTGIGIQAEHLDSLFSDYVKLDAKVNRGIEGSGLGLPIAKRLAELMEGTITVESEYGKGSCFTVKLKQKYVNAAVIGPEA